MSDDQWLFSYGTLGDPAVQVATFGRVLEGHPDRLPGFSKALLEITDPDVVRTSGQTHHPIITATSNPDAAVPGHVLRLTAAELAAADDYEVDDYTRIKVRLCSGTDAWVYANVLPAGMPNFVAT